MIGAVDLELTTAASPEDAKTISQGIVDFNRRAQPTLEAVEDEVRFFVFARDAAGAVTGGIRAACYWNTLHIELVWLAESCRGSGAGSRMLHMAEDFAREHGCELALVETTSWQAKGFYEKAGFAPIATVHGRPRGQSTHTLLKRLAPPTDAAGVA